MCRIHSRESNVLRLRPKSFYRTIKSSPTRRRKSPPSRARDAVERERRRIVRTKRARMRSLSAAMTTHSRADESHSQQLCQRHSENRWHETSAWDDSALILRTRTKHQRLHSLSIWMIKTLLVSRSSVVRVAASPRCQMVCDVAVSPRILCDQPAPMAAIKLKAKSWIWIRVIVHRSAHSPRVSVKSANNSRAWCRQYREERELQFKWVLIWCLWRLLMAFFTYSSV